ncbi:TPA: helix-turn-helix domain-containing protein [Campylobacter fetus subsp. venerealis]|uniref:Transcriptional regulator n=2 Tax=Campylobacter fetus subsp. venerealis TaxID=32020 RepID=A0AAE6MAS6_CAMFE|nr:helix-turn-helix domain-containing protein [Campylobacter fetus]OCS31314.1 hypothetical protein CFVLMG6570_06370 [Campylobacter fetus subsp. venerealis LMG 6570 = CCUG 33900]OCS41639.1 hypothetical protein CFVI02298_06645 [Campylobacter fetus subsp. venerealis cfvi02/298]ACA64443.1 hypothetical protein [Campylobacter fetus subsp. venerealis NCTC 10354]AHE94567.1 putative DNA binding protein, possible transcriptional regulator [Campylobacter fetus subsp. venerealis cfvi03/293]AIR80982.1 pred
MKDVNFYEKYITPSELEEMFGISQSTQYKLRMQKNYTDENRQKHIPIPFVKIGNRILYNIDSIKKWLKNIEQK